MVDLERLRELEERGFVDGDENTPGSYKHFLQEKQAAIKERFRKSFKENALKTLAKQIKRGYQGDSKELLSQMLDLEELYDYYYPNDKNGQTKRRAKSEDEEDEDGKTVDESDGELGGGSGLFNGARVEVESLLKEYRGSKRMEVGDFWEEVKDILASVPEMGDFSAEISYIDESLSQYTDVSQLYDYIMRAFFGSD